MVETKLFPAFDCFWQRKVFKNYDFGKFASHYVVIQKLTIMTLGLKIRRQIHSQEIRNYRKHPNLD